MKRIWSNLNWRNKVALLAFVLGFVGLFAGSPYQGARATVDTRELALDIQKELDHVAVTELADWLIQNRADFRLLDLRGEQDYAVYHIPSSENVPIGGLADYSLLRNEKIILYSDGGVHSAQAWYLLRATGFKHVYILRGGLEAWHEKILFPRLPETATAAQKAEFEKLAAISKHFGGSPETGGTEATTAPQRALPKLSAPPASGGPSGGAAPKKKKEGC